MSVRFLEGACLALTLVAAACNANLGEGSDGPTAVTPPTPLRVAGVPGTDRFGIGPSEIEFGSLAPVVTESGLISLSLDASGTNGGAYQFRGGAPGTLRVDKPAGATVRRAFLAAASTGFTGRRLNDGDVTLDGTGISWAISTPSSIASWNHWAEVTALVKPKIDAAATGIVSFDVGEVNTTGIDGEILAVIFDDPAQTTSNTVILLFGAQNIAGDTFNIALGSPVDKTDPNLGIDLSLGISFGFQDPSLLVQRSIVDVNGTRLTSFAGGQDDGQADNGALMTVGGIGDSNANPSPMAVGPDARGDDELYDLLPFVPDGATTITVFSQNPSNDDNILFAALNLHSAAAIVGEGIVLGPSPAPDSEVGTAFTLTATVQDANGHPISGRTVTFTVTAGPDAGTTGTAVTDAAGHASFTYTGAAAGMDEISATFVDSQGHVQTSNTVLKRWTRTNRPPIAVCQDVTRAVDATCHADVQPAEVGGGSSDPDGDPLSLALDPAGPFSLGNTSVILTATDITHLSSTCEAVVTAIDQTPPAVTCPSPASAECSGNTSGIVTLGNASAADNCGSPIVTGPAGSASYPLGSTLVTFLATDGSGNTASCTTTATVVDTLSPVITCPDPFTAECTGNHAATVSVSNATAADVCSSVVVTGSAGTSSFPIGTSTIGFTAADTSGNTATCTTQVTVVDTTAPAIRCAAPIVAECTGNRSATVDVPNASASDVCGGTAVTGPAGPASYPLGTTTLGFSATDDFGNLASCATTVTVADTTAPVFDPTTLGPRTVLGSCDGSAISFPPPVATDSCQATTVTCDPLPGDRSGENHVTCTATDGSGNTTTVTITVTVLQPLRLAFQAPLSDDNVADDINTDADDVNLFEVKRTIPNQIKVFSCSGEDVTRAIADSVTLRLTVSLRDTTSSGPGTPITPSFTGVGDADGVLVLTGNHFHYNQKTDPADYPAGTINTTSYFDNIVTLTYNSAPSIIAGQEDARLESK